MKPFEYKDHDLVVRTRQTGQRLWVSKATLSGQRRKSQHVRTGHVMRTREVFPRSIFWKADREMALQPISECSHFRG
jgi:hypothetical protein